MHIRHVSVFSLATIIVLDDHSENYISPMCYAFISFLTSSRITLSFFGPNYLNFYLTGLVVQSIFGECIVILV